MDNQRLFSFRYINTPKQVGVQVFAISFNKNNQLKCDQKIMLIWGKLVKKAHKKLFRHYNLKNKQPEATSLRYVLGGFDSYALSVLWSIPQMFIFYSFPR